MYPSQPPWPGHQQPQELHPAQPPNGNYPQAPPNQSSTPTTLPPLTGMASTYRLPAPPPHQNMMYRPMGDPYGQPQQMQYAGHPAPAPRQRTAIACRYCRRRKIRCSGFENSEDGRCQNCTRFSQECIFTPVSAQTQAFVPAHTVYRQGQAPPAQLYGAYGQPLPSSQAPDPYAARGGPQGGPGPYPGAQYAPQGYVPAPANPHDDRNGTYGGRKRPNDEPHGGPSLPPPNPATGRSGGGEQRSYAYPDPTTLAPAAGAVSPASSSASYHSAPYPNPGAAPQPYYVNPPPSSLHHQHHQPPDPRQRPSPTNSQHGGYDHTSRASASPHSQSQSFGASDPGLRPPGNMPPRSEGRTPPPGAQGGGNGNGNRPSMSISSIVQGSGNGSQGQSGRDSGEGSSPGTRSAADSDMLNRLRR